MGRRAHSHLQRRLGGAADATGGRHCACSSRRDRDTALAAHGPSGARPPPALAEEGADTLGRWHTACLHCRDREALLVAHTWASRRALATSDGWGVLSRRADGTVRTRPFASATRRWRHTHGCAILQRLLGGLHRACSSRRESDVSLAAHTGRRTLPPAPAGEGGVREGGGGHDGRTAQCVLIPLRSRRAAGGTWAAWRAPPSSNCRGGRRRTRRADGTQRACTAVTRSWWHTHGPPGARLPPVTVGEGRRDGRTAQRVLVPPRSRRAAGVTHMGRQARPPGSSLPVEGGCCRAVQACSASCDRGARVAAHTWAVPARAPADRGRGVWSRRANSLGTCLSSVCLDVLGAAHT